MSIDKAFREMIRQEVELQLRPIQSAMSQLRAGTKELLALRALAERLAPLGSLLGRGGARAAQGARGVVGLKAQVAARRGRGGKRIRVVGSNDRSCALIGCGSRARSKGYCAAHYQKFRMLDRTGRLPADWMEYAPEASVNDIILPRGRAAVKALRDSKSKDR
jgi:hypothetical protein